MTRSTTMESRHIHNIARKNSIQMKGEDILHGRVDGEDEEDYGDDDGEGDGDEFELIDDRVQRK